MAAGQDRIEVAQATSGGTPPGGYDNPFVMQAQSIEGLFVRTTGGDKQAADELQQDLMSMHQMLRGTSNPNAALEPLNAQFAADAQSNPNLPQLTLTTDGGSPLEISTGLLNQGGKNFLEDENGGIQATGYDAYPASASAAHFKGTDYMNGIANLEASPLGGASDFSATHPGAATFEYMALGASEGNTLDAQKLAMSLGALQGNGQDWMGDTTVSLNSQFQNDQQYGGPAFKLSQSDGLTTMQVSYADGTTFSENSAGALASHKPNIVDKILNNLP